MNNICLVTMPFTILEYPSIALGCLKSSLLNETGIKPDIYYANLDFAEWIGKKLYDYISLFPFISDFSFAHIANENYQPDYKRFVNLFMSSKIGISPQQYKESENILYLINDKSTKFIDYLANRILTQKPILVGCSSTFEQNIASLALLKRIKFLNPSTVTILGGACYAATMGVRLASKFNWIDYVFSGEADESFPKIVKLIMEYGVDIPEHKFPVGLINKKNSIEFLNKKCAPYAIVNNLDKIHCPDYDDFFTQLNEKSFSKSISPYLMIESSRGCWWGEKHQCNFCGMNAMGSQFRKKSPEKILNEMNDLSEKYKTEKIFFVDTTIPMNYFSDMLPKLAKQPKKYSIFYQMRSNINYEQIKILSEAGVTRVQLGIESFIDDALKLMNKGCSAIQNIKALRDLREFEIDVDWNFLCKIPGEKDSWYAELALWLPLLFHFFPPIGLNRIFLSRFSPYYNNSEKYGLQLKPSELYEFIYPKNKEDIHDLCNYFDVLNEEFKSTFTDAPLDKPGLQSVGVQIEIWKKLWETEQKPNLIGYIKDDIIEISDTRPCQFKSFYQLNQLQSEILKICKRHQKYNEIFQKISEKNDFQRITTDELNNELKVLISYQIVINLNDKYLCLAILKNDRLPSR